jgi:hypothetical protein
MWAVSLGWSAHIPRLKISHRLFAARCVAAIINRGRLLPRRYRPEPRLSLRCLRVAHNASDYWSVPVTKPHVVVVLVPMIRATAFACRYKNKLGVIGVSMARVAAGAFGFLILDHALDVPLSFSRVWSGICLPNADTQAPFFQIVLCEPV